MGLWFNLEGEEKEICPNCGHVLDTKEDVEYYSANITHNLATMASEAGVYEALWMPDENGYEKAADIFDILTAGLKDLYSRPDFFKQFNPSNGWGDYDGLVAFVSSALAACGEYPHANIRASR